MTRFIHITDNVCPNDDTFYSFVDMSISIPMSTDDVLLSLGSSSSSLLLLFVGETTRVFLYTDVEDGRDEVVTCDVVSRFWDDDMCLSLFVSSNNLISLSAFSLTSITWPLRQMAIKPPVLSSKIVLLMISSAILVENNIVL